MLETKLGVAKADITPRKPLPLAGFAHREGNFEGISHRLQARVLFFEQAEKSKKQRTLLVSADLIWWGPDRIRGLRRRLKERWGLNEDSVILHATHTHSGPQTSVRFTSQLGKSDPDYLEKMESSVLAAVDRAADGLETITVEQGRGECHIGINRRQRVGDEIEMAPNEHGPTDPEVGVFQFQTGAGKTKAILVHYACHPTTTDDNLISSEFPGVAMELVENELGEEVVAAYLQGCCGDIRPALTRERDFYRGSDAEVRQLGVTLANEVLSVMNRPMKVLSSCRLDGRYTTVPLPFQELPTRADLKAKKRRPNLVGEWSRLLLREPERVQPSIPLEMSLQNIADGLSLLAINGEVVVDYGLLVKQRFGGRILPVPYSNGMIGYIPTARQVLEGGYEAKESTLYFGLPAPFAPGLESKIHDGIVSLVEAGLGEGGK